MAVTAATERPYRDGDIARYQVDANQKVYAGALVQFSASGEISNATKGDAAKYAGVALQSHEAGASPGAADKVEVRRRGVFHFKAAANTITMADIGKKAYVADNETITDAATGAAACGWIVDIDSDGVWVELDPAVMYAGS